MRYCKHCGCELKENQEVCLNCGSILKKEEIETIQKDNLFWILGLVFGILGLVSFGLTFAFTITIFASFFSSILAILFGILGIIKKNKLGILGLIMGIFSFLGSMGLVIYGLFLLSQEPKLIDDTPSLNGTWHLSDESTFVIGESNEFCALSYENGETYKGTCEYEKSTSEDGTLVLSMVLESIQYKGTTYDAKEYYETENPSFIWNVSFDSEFTTFYNLEEETTVTGYTGF